MKKNQQQKKDQQQEKKKKAQMTRKRFVEVKMLNPRATSNDQLPPKTEGFTFCNASSKPVAVRNLEVWDGNDIRVLGPLNVGPVAPGTCVNLGFNEVDGVKVTCVVKWSGGQILMGSEGAAAGHFVSYAAYGVRDGTVPQSIFGWGVDIMADGDNRGI